MRGNVVAQINADVIPPERSLGNGIHEAVEIKHIWRGDGCSMANLKIICTGLLRTQNQNPRSVIIKTMVQDFVPFSSSFYWGRKALSFFCKEKSRLPILNCSISHEWGTKIKSIFFKRYASRKKPLEVNSNVLSQGLWHFFDLFANGITLLSCTANSRFVKM